ncbi:MAG: hypothetical protein E6Q97_06665 [Desulfurellales bacterium]|nr:MAG: hypothetical protein E6Q97_06665 [Desulfurellales bacterium]
MQRGKLILPVEGWKGIVSKYPKAHAQVPQDALTAGTENVKVSNRGALVKREGGAKFTAFTLPFGAPADAIKDMYEAVFTDGTRYLLTMSNGQLDYSTGGGDFTKAQAGYTAAANMEFASYRDKVYFSNSAENPQVLERATGYGSVLSTPCTITIVTAADLAGDSVTIGTTTKTEGSHWTKTDGDNAATATSLASALSAISGVTATAVGAVVTVTATSTLNVWTTDATAMTVAATSGPRIKDMGCQPPSTAPSSLTPGAGGSVPEDTYYYKVTFLYYGAEESNGSPESASVTVGVGESSVAMTIPLGGYGVSARKIYRSTDQISFGLVGTVENNTATTFTDTASIDTTTIPDDNGQPRKFAYLAQFKDRIWYAGISGATADLDFSEAGQANIFPSFNNIVCNPEDEITAIVPFNDRLVVFSKRSFGQILGTTADSFFYEAFPGSIGCVDNRSVQVRTLRGVPVLIWLSDKGFYAFNGSSVEYISEAIEDLVNLNIQQVRFLDGTNTQDTSTQFTAGTSSTGIDVTSAPGFLTTKGFTGGTNPVKDTDAQAEWEAGSGSFRVTQNTTYPNQLMAPTRRVFSYGEGELDASLNVDGSNLKLDVAADNTGETANGRKTLPATAPSKTASKIVLPRAGAITFNGSVFTGTPGRTARHVLWADALGTPGSVIENGPTFNVTVTTIPHPTDAHTFAEVPAGTYWIGSEAVSGAVSFYGPTFTSGGNDVAVFTSSWTAATTSGSAFAVVPSYSVVQTAVVSSGEWVSPSYDTGLFADTEGLVATVAGAYTAAGTGTSNVAVVVGMADTQDDLENEDGSYTSQTIAAFDGSDAVTQASTKRWLNLKVTLTQSDDRYTPTLAPLTLSFAGTATWVSPAIDVSADATKYNLAVSRTVPAGTTATVGYRSADTEGGLSGAFTPVSFTAEAASITGATVKRWVQFEVVTTTDAANSVSARVSALQFDWELTANWQSAAIDLGSTPSALSLFLADAEANGGTIAYSMREAASEGGLSSATYYSVESGEYPETTNANHTPLRWVQLKAVLTAKRDKVPAIDSMTVQWFRSEGTSIRAASLFHDRSYYCAVAQSGQTQNNMMLVFDEYGNWTKYTGVVPVSISMFYAIPYYGTATGNIIRFFDGTTDAGTNITMDVRTKAFDFRDITKRKALRSVVVTGLNNGATYAPYYSVDEGVTWISLYDSLGQATFTVGTDGSEFVRKLSPRWPNEINGKTLSVRLVEASATAAEIHNISIIAFVREGEILSA